MADDRVESVLRLRRRGRFDLLIAILIGVIGQILCVWRLWSLEDKSVEASGESVLNVVLYPGGTLGEWVAFHVPRRLGTHVAILLGNITGFALQVAIFAVFAFGLICLARLMSLRLPRHP